MTVDSTTIEKSNTRRRFLASQSSPGRGGGGCDQHPLACRETEGSAGPDCHNKKCVDIRTDISNCGSCGKRCSSSEICCNAHCVNPMSHKYMHLIGCAAQICQ
ncbi:hypothetical protein PRUPE_4G199900 [Prunus persica]|uniref:Uncharacterized protein n=1 Tax=Prunus persica TaxID=3760 RepID=A0A251PNB5_PRUPE|nr:hypothetical protein PRUPE_4G199900 [Prunus persica]